MKKKALSLFLTLVLCLLLPTVALADSISDDHKVTLNFTGDCYNEHTEQVYLNEYLPEDAIVTGFTPSLANIVKQFSYEYQNSTNANVENASFTYTTRIYDEPASGIFTVTVSTSNYGNYVFTINITLTGKYLVTLSALPQNAFCDGQAHPGYSNVKGTLTSGAAYTGDYALAYAKKDGTPLDGAPSETGDYTVTISIPEENEGYKHKENLTLEFSILADAEAQYQTEANGKWYSGAFEEALADVYEGGTIRLLKDVILNRTATAAKKMTITSADPGRPCTITSNTDQHGYLLNVTGEVSLKNVIVDGGSKTGITAKRAAISVNGGKLILGRGATVQNNNNTTQNGVGGGVCVISGELYLDDAAITGNHGYFGGAVGMVGGTCYARSGMISGNTAQMGGGISVWEGSASAGTLYISGTISVAGNSAIAYAGGIQCSNTGKIYLSGSPTIHQNTSREETNGGIYLDGTPDDGFAIVKVNGKLSDAANVSFYSWKGSGGFVLAESIDSYTITADDVGTMHYDGIFGIKLTDDNKAVLTDAGVYQITFDANGGSIKTEMTKTAEGKLMSLPAPTRSGYRFAGWFTEIEGGERVTTDTVFTADTTIYARWTRNSSSGSFSGGTTQYPDSVASDCFVDVPANAYYYDAVQWAVENGVTDGMDDSHFAPDQSCTRAQIVTFLWRAAGCPVADTANPFGDVRSGDYFYEAVLWAVENDITEGTSATTFSPGEPCTRAQAAAFLMRFAAYQGVDAVTMQELVSGFGDAAQVPGYALSAFNWALGSGIVEGYHGNLMPNASCTRAQIVTMLYRMLER